MIAAVESSKAAQESASGGGDNRTTAERSSRWPQLLALPRWSLLALVPPTTLLGIAGGPVARVGIAVAGVGEVVALIGGPLALVGEVVALVGVPLPLIEVVLGPVQSRGASGQAGLGGLQRLLGLPARASAARTRASSTARAATRSRWAAWTTSWARSASLRDDDLARSATAGTPPPGSPPGGDQHPLGLLDPDPTGQRLPPS